MSFSEQDGFYTAWSAFLMLAFKLLGSSPLINSNLCKLDDDVAICTMLFIWIFIIIMNWIDAMVIGSAGDVIKVKGMIQTTQISRLSSKYDPTRPEISKYVNVVLRASLWLQEDLLT